MFADKRIALLTYGSRGDVQPNVAIALALQKLGANVTLAAYDDHAEFVTQCGVRRFVGWGHTARSKFELLKDLMGDSSPGALQKVYFSLSKQLFSRLTTGFLACGFTYHEWIIWPAQ